MLRMRFDNVTAYDRPAVTLCVPVRQIHLLRGDPLAYEAGPGCDTGYDQMVLVGARACRILLA